MFHVKHGYKLHSLFNKNMFLQAQQFFLDVQNAQALLSVGQE